MHGICIYVYVQKDRKRRSPTDASWAALGTAELTSRAEPHPSASGTVTYRRYVGGRAAGVQAIPIARHVNSRQQPSAYWCDS